MYAFTHYGIEPDIVCLGKGLGNGIPVSAAVGRSDVFASLGYGQASDTWSANPLSAAAVVATLDEFESTDVLGHAAKLAEVLERGLLRLVESGAVAHIRGEGLVWGIECQAIGNRSAADVANACVEACYLGDEQGRAVHLLGPLAGKVIRISPPLVLPIEEAESYLDAMCTCFTDAGAAAKLKQTMSKLKHGGLEQPLAATKLSRRFLNAEDTEVSQSRERMDSASWGSTRR